MSHLGFGLGFGSDLLDLIGGIITPPPDYPLNVVTYGGLPVTLDGQYVTYSGHDSLPDNVVTVNGIPLVYAGEYVTYTSEEITSPEVVTLEGEPITFNGEIIYYNA